MDNEKLDLDLTGVDGNAFAILAFFKRAALKAGWTNEKIKEVMYEATSKDYNHLIATICRQ